jgi:uncharacterized phage-associated protein
MIYETAAVANYLLDIGEEDNCPLTPIKLIKLVKEHFKKVVKMKE